MIKILINIEVGALNSAFADLHVQLFMYTQMGFFRVIGDSFFFDLPYKNQIFFQDVATPVMEGILNFHHDLVFFLLVIGVFVFKILICILKNFRFFFFFDSLGGFKANMVHLIGWFNSFEFRGKRERRGFFFLMYMIYIFFYEFVSWCCFPYIRYYHIRSQGIFRKAQNVTLTEAVSRNFLSFEFLSLLVPCSFDNSVLFRNSLIFQWLVIKFSPWYFFLLRIFLNFILLGRKVGQCFRFWFFIDIFFNVFMDKHFRYLTFLNNRIHKIIGKDNFVTFGLSNRKDKNKGYNLSFFSDYAFFSQISGLLSDVFVSSCLPMNSIVFNKVLKRFNIGAGYFFFCVHPHIFSGLFYLRFFNVSGNTVFFNVVQYFFYRSFFIIDLILVSVFLTLKNFLYCMLSFLFFFIVLFYLCFRFLILLLMWFFSRSKFITFSRVMDRIFVRRSFKNLSKLTYLVDALNSFMGFLSLRSLKFLSKNLYFFGFNCAQLLNFYMIRIYLFIYYLWNLWNLGRRIRFFFFKNVKLMQKLFLVCYLHFYNKYMTYILLRCLGFYSYFSVIPAFFLHIRWFKRLKVFLFKIFYGFAPRRFVHFSNKFPTISIFSVFLSKIIGNSLQKINSDLAFFNLNFFKRERIDFFVLIFLYYRERPFQRIAKHTIFSFFDFGKIYRDELLRFKKQPNIWAHRLSIVQYYQVLFQPVGFFTILLWDIPMPGKREYSKILYSKILYFEYWLNFWFNYQNWFLKIFHRDLVADNWLSKRFNAIFKFFFFFIV